MGKKKGIKRETYARPTFRTKRTLFSLKTKTKIFEKFEVRLSYVSLILLQA